MLWHRWSAECKLENFGIYEPERWRERMAWAKTTIIVETITSYFNSQQDSSEQRKAFTYEFRNIINKQGYVTNPLF